ncbi:polysaccharide deacetylase family protein [Candidatus Pandoraea novymonadis]|uniref:4-deoxy-4-formamido-L-arabinose-phosphoundecaprenol deformylase ArnD n=1 Tax=Candidatus Pandoraea novymonadis TaxID=1808959 RepID=A0ABX5FEH5_9BURK|nr:polysaccharide deacetylase family protein [Candidatus Pandoraea novymonadis]PSB92066.1 putative 4-deoxy-4-formamido-L-arabinose-phosphoundecaprenol deformylase ArnD [Candidatus Pandoraea novymonadis]
MAHIVLKIDVDTLRGTREGVPNLIRLLESAHARATFLFSLGPDHTGWALKRLFRRGFLKKVTRTSIIEHYGFKTLMYGTLLPGPDIGIRAVNAMRAVAKEGHETGIHTWDHVYWQDNVRMSDAVWTKRQMKNAYTRYIEIFDTSPVTHGAAGWQMNAHAFRQIDRWDMKYASDGRGNAPHYPIVDGQRLNHVQIPTTLPTVDELIGINGLDADGVLEYLLTLTINVEKDHVFTLHAELEGQKLAPLFSKLLTGWTDQGYSLVAMEDYYSTLDLKKLPAHSMVWGRINGRAGELILEGATPTL